MTRLRLQPEAMPGLALHAEICPSMLQRQPLTPGEVVPVELPAALLRAYAGEGAC
ncbi:hypothetical protein JOS77_22295 [Chromobacterium haemolyticum]|nr:hypothetical protein JOS77_22295 [Chromobacterium haemolyticum]